MALYKQEEWEELAVKFARTVDKLGTGIDTGILETVIALNALGIETAASCEGHLDHGTGAPWIDIEVLTVSEQSRQVARLFTRAHQAFEQQTLPTADIDVLFAEAHREKERVKLLHLAQRQKLMDLLTAFYQNRHVPFDRLLVVHPRDTTGRSRLESQGADFQNVAPLDKRERKLVEYQEEIQAFTAFLKQVYFSDR
jgi:hypothetical protein